MPRNIATAIQNNFTGGFVTQATALDFPENSAFDQNNVVFSELGIAQRRPGMDYENNFVLQALTSTEKAQVTYLWKNAAGDGNTNFVVHQNGDTLSFFNTNSQLSLSAGLSANTITLSSFEASGATSDNLNQNECQFSTGLGYLFVVHPYCDPFYILYNPSDGSFTSSIITFTVRDLIGIQETGVLVNNRPTSLTAAHEYNLYNQGWNSTRYNTFSTATTAPPLPVLTALTTGGTLAAGTVFVKLSLVNAAGETIASPQASVVTTGTTSSVVITAPVEFGTATGYKVYASAASGTEVLQPGGTIAFGTNYTITSLTTGTASPLTTATTGTLFPSNVDVWWTFNDDTDTFNPATTMPSVDGGSSQAPQGFFRLNPWSTARVATALAQAGITITLANVDQTSGALRPSVTEFHAGRVFYAGVNSPGYNSNIYFSKIIQQPADFGSCMADDDPTSQTLFDFLPSDGGIIAIPQAGTIYKLVSLGATLLVFGANGVWAISGSTGIGFDATDYSVGLVGLVRSVSGTSFVTIDGSVAWWNLTGINIVQNDPQKGLFISSMTDQKIKDYYLGLPSASIRFARGYYNPRTHVLQWLFRTATFASISQTYSYDSVLNYNTLIGAWYTWDLPSDTVMTNSIVVLEGAGSLTGSNTIVDNSANTVLDNAGDTLITYGFAQTTVTTTTKFLVYNGTEFTFAEAFNPSFMDWSQEVAGGEDYESFFTTGFLVKTQGERRFQTNYLFVFSDLSDALSTQNAYTFQALWNYGTSGNTGEWSQRQTISQNIVHTETNFDAGRRKLKVRGAGTALQFKFSSVSGQPFNIIGWSTYDTANQAV